MSFLFTLSNIAVPLILLSFKTLIKSRNSLEVGAAQWFCFILFTFFSNLLFYLFYHSNIYLLADLALKLAIVFMPEKLTAKIQTKISHLHLEILIDHIRSHIIEKFFTAHSYLTEIALLKMDDIEQKQFKQALIQQLNDENEEQKTQSDLAKKIEGSKHRFESIGVSCDIITTEMLEKEQDERKKLKRILSDKNLHETLKETNKAEQEAMGVSFKKKNSYLMQRSSTDLFLEEEDDEDIQKPAKSSHKKGGDRSMNQTKKQEGEKRQKGVGEKEKEKEKEKRMNKKQPQMFNKVSAIEKKEETGEDSSLILNKLDVSDYSDMFEDEEGENGQLLTKVEAIIEIGSGATVRLEIYNIELYSNNTIRIMSLYGREFQKHELVSMKAQKHGYFELHLKGGKVDKRRVKFRGKYDQFNKFVLPTE